MARARKRKTARKRVAARRKAIVEQSRTNWQIGAGVFALAVVFGAAAYMVSVNDDARAAVASFVERIEIPQAVKEFPDKVKQQLPEMPALTNTSPESAPNESAPARQSSAGQKSRSDPG